ncbi:MAG: hypothetical protein SFV51_11925 [Bryobacteraceae bacterium]|nr:hypothetical protein [Bryobacteraceae bacterium]
MFAKAKVFAQHVLPAVIKPLRVLWNEMIAFVFVLLGTMGGFATWREYKTGKLSMVAMGALFSAVMIYYGLSSFLRARKIQRS